MPDMRELTIYNKKHVYEKEIAPYINEIKKICRLNKIPGIFTFAVANNHKSTEYITDGCPTGSMGLELADDRFEHYLVALQKGKKLVLVDANVMDPEEEKYISEYADEEDYEDGNYVAAVLASYKNAFEFIGDL